MSADVTLTRDDLLRLATGALVAAGASAAQAHAVAEATVQAEERGLRPVGIAHLFDYLDGLHCGRIIANEPLVERRTPVVWAVDCRDGVAQHGFAVIVDDLAEAARVNGVALAALSSTFTVGELGHYVRELSSRGLVALAFANSPALMSVAGARGPLFGTNPQSFGLPLPDGRRLLVDQASSATAWVAVRAAAERGEPIPAGFAVDLSGAPTTDAAAGLAGALLPFGGYKGGNVALLVELLATIAGGTFSSDAPPFQEGDRSPGVGCLVIALSFDVLAPGYPARLATQLERWSEESCADPSVWIDKSVSSTIAVPREVHERLLEEAGADRSRLRQDNR
jgi:(2R)-3-sulfolactate dehydrogenase (NADP+)